MGNRVFALQFWDPVLQKFVWEGDIIQAHDHDDAMGLAYQEYGHGVVFTVVESLADYGGHCVLGVF